MKKVSLIVMMAIVSMGMVALKGEAIVIPAEPLVIHISDAASNYRGDSPLQPGAPLQPGDEDRAIGNIDQIFTSYGESGGWGTKDTIWQWNPSGGEELGFVWYDLVINSVTITKLSSTQWRVDTHYTDGTRYGDPYTGGRIDVWYDTTPDYNQSNYTGAFAGPGAWQVGNMTTGGDDYPGVSDVDWVDINGNNQIDSGELQPNSNSLWLTGTLVPMFWEPDPTNTTTVPIVYTSVFEFDPLTGAILPGGLNTGTAFVKILGGSAQNLFLRNMFDIDGDGINDADIWIQQTFTTGINGTLGQWQVTSSDPLRAYGTPEPGTIFLIGFGLLGAGLIGRRKKEV
ncbi:MAG: hypothetical protein B6D55_03790 [Candidatus Omnitrophica bacterium 4484_70.2]|nr:MAG: hypothetical protein B6D55_03790 [Candidatus Omnitrophica bacterium 4484_70.2]